MGPLTSVSRAHYDDLINTLVLHFNVLDGGKDDPNGVEKEMKEVVSHGHLISTLVLPQTTDVETEIYLE